MIAWRVHSCIKDTSKRTLLQFVESNIQILPTAWVVRHSHGSSLAQNSSRYNPSPVWEASFVDIKCPVEVLSPLLFQNLIYITLIHVFILGSFHCIRFPTSSVKALNLNSLSPYFFPCAYLSSHFPYCYLHPSITIYSIYFSSWYLYVPAAPLLYAYPLWFYRLELGYH